MSTGKEKGMSRKLFGKGSSQPTQESVVGDNLRGRSNSTLVQVDGEPIEIDDDFDPEYWLKKMKENDEIAIQLENKEVDECHPVEDPKAAAAYNSDEDNEDASDAEHVGDETTDEDNDDSSDDGVELNDQGKECEEDPEYYKKFQADNPEFEDEPGELFDDSDLKHMEDMKKENTASVVYLEEAGVESWARAFFDDTSKREHLNNNFSESFNSMAKNLRDKPVCRLGILYNQLVMSIFHKRRKESASWNPHELVPTAMKLIGKMMKLVGAFKVEPCVSGKLYEVINEGSKADFIVNLYCSHYYSVAAYMATYAPVVFPFPAQEDWPELQEHEKIELESAIKIRKTGRPRVKRRRACDEPKSKTKVYSCRNCGSTGHNKSTCKGGDVGKNPKAKRQRTQVDGANFTFNERPVASISKAKKSQPSSSKAASSSKAKKSQPSNIPKAPAKASTASKKHNNTHTKK
ncbi:uncharacterized protein LOC113336639 [Papaver somniferum]|uniref:uncharacterized protein LOC113336639 n=1 Tax=Papaver somniferum TaxID=3469 RepID=UPI000E700208|nr:uncharacterized protein LOC113336639 [Papaver somniferum]